MAKRVYEGIILEKSGHDVQVGQIGWKEETHIIVELDDGGRMEIRLHKKVKTPVVIGDRVRFTWNGRSYVKQLELVESVSSKLFESGSTQ